jgi:hypothetical protein
MHGIVTAIGLEWLRIVLRALPGIADTGTSPWRYLPSDCAPMLHDLLADHIRDPHASWACGRFGAIAEFHRDPDEPAEIATGPVISTPPTASASAPSSLRA